MPQKYVEKLAKGLDGSARISHDPYGSWGSDWRVGFIPTICERSMR